MRRALRTWLLPLHRWTGMSVGLVLVLMAVTGAATLLRPRLEPFVNAALLTVPTCAARVPLDALAARAAAAHAGSRLEAIHLVAGADTEARMPAAELRFDDQVYVYLDPCSGAMLGQRGRFGGTLGTIEQVHRFRFMEHGSIITGSCALLFVLLLAGGGLCLWLPATVRGLRQALKLNLRFTGQARRLNLHKTVGMYASLVVLASALTGLPQAFGWYEAALYALTASPRPARPAAAGAPAGAVALPIEALWQRAQLLLPAPQDALLRFAPGRDEPLELVLIARDAPHPNARTMLYLDRYSGATVRFTPYGQNSAGHRLFYWTLSWHTGQVGGWPAQLLLLAGALSVPLLAYTGISSYLRRKRRVIAAGRIAVRVLRKQVECEDVVSFELGMPDGSALPPFAAGAHIDVFIGGGLVRQYSLCNDPHDSHRYLIAVQREPHSRGASRALHERIGEGDLIEIGAPKNYFPLAEHGGRSILLAGGIGVAPLLAMAERLARTGAPFALHLCARTHARAPFVQRLRRARFAQHAHFHFSDGAPAQLLDLPALLDGGGEGGAHLYVCGPTGFITSAIEAAQRAGWPAERIHMEFFAGGVQPGPDDAAFDVIIASSGQRYRVAHDQTVLAALDAAGVAVPSACRQGVCGSCITRVLDGLPEHRDRYLTPGEQARNDQFAPCCSRARGPALTLDL